MAVPRPLEALTLALMALTLVACGPAQPVPPSTQDALAWPEVQETMAVGVYIPPLSRLGDLGGQIPTDLPLHSLDPNGSWWDPQVRRFVYSGIYRLDDTFTPVPDLAAEPCAVSDDLLVVTCELREASFHDGTAVTADDVAFTYGLLISDACRMPGLCVDFADSRLVAATATGQRSVEFRLSEPDPTFLTTMLPDVMIEPRERVVTAFNSFIAATGDADPPALQLAALAVAPPNANGVPTCAPVDDPSVGEAILGEAEGAMAALELALRDRDFYGIGPDGTFEACAYAEYLGRVLTDAAEAMTLTGTDAIAAAYPILDLPLIPVGSGPWRVTSIDPGAEMTLDAFDAYHHGAPVTARIEVTLFVALPEAVDAVRTGAVDWLQDPFNFGENFVAEGAADAEGFVWTDYHGLSYRVLNYNLREGFLFADPNLRAAMELCIDKEESVAAATGDQGVPVYSPITPAMWAYQPDLPKPVRDVEAGIALIEASGWTLGEDGVYRKGDVRLATSVPVIDNPQHVHFLELVAFQVADCGIQITPQPMPLGDLGVGLDWPLIVRGAEKPWDAILAGWITGWDPDPSLVYHSRHITTEENPRGFNYVGYDSERGDALLDEARSTYDLRARARLYREYQLLLAADRPVLFGWSPRLREARSDRMESTAGPLRTDTGLWWWQLETLYVRSADG